MRVIGWKISRNLVEVGRYNIGKEQGNSDNVCKFTYRMLTINDKLGICNAFS